MKFSQIAAVAFLALSAQAAIVNNEAQAMKRDETSTIVQEIVAEGEKLTPEIVAFLQKVAPLVIEELIKVAPLLLAGLV